MNAASAVAVAVDFVWLGMVLAISFLEAPLKFRAPGITVPPGPGTGRLVFQALNIAEVTLAVTLTAAMPAGNPGAGDGTGTAILIALWILLAGQAAVLRPRLDRHARLILACRNPPRSRQHLACILLEGGKVMLLPALGILLVLRLTA